MAQFTPSVVFVIFSGGMNSPPLGTICKGADCLIDYMCPTDFGLFVFAGIAWALWRSRNKTAIERHFPSNPLEVILSGIVLV
jgi:hypothetical protein